MTTDAPRRISDTTAAFIATLCAVGLAVFAGQALAAQLAGARVLVAMCIIAALGWLAVRTGWVRR